MKKLILSNLFFFATIALMAQDFTPGWYVIQASARYTVISPSSSDFSGNYNEEKEAYDYPDISDLLMAAGEVVIAFDYSGGKVYCFDPNGRMLAFEGLGSLSKAPIVPGCGVGVMSETIELIDGSELSSGSYYWIIGQDIAKSTIKIQVHNGTYDIPRDKIMLLSATIKKLIKSETFKAVKQ